MRKLSTDEIKKIENDIDEFLFKKLDSRFPMHSYIYHCNLVHIDLNIDQKMMFSKMERHYLTALNHNTYIAHKKLIEEEKFDYRFNESIYKYAFKMMLNTIQYSFLCDYFPLLHSGKAEAFISDEGVIEFKVKKIAKKNNKYINDYLIRKALSYTLQIANGKFIDENLDDEELAMKLADEYSFFWSENMEYSDYEPYTRLDWAGISFFFTIASMRRFNKLYKNDFDIIKTDSQKMMILLSPKGMKELREYCPQCSDELYSILLNDNIYRPIGNGYYPKVAVSELPLNYTRDGYLYVNPFVILFENSGETRYLNALRKIDSERYQIVKDKIKEKEIPLIEAMINYRFKNIKFVSNFYVPIPKTKKNKRECDILLVDENGYALYIEIKHFYYPSSFSEMKILDKELNKALNKMPDQIDAIKQGWDYIKSNYNIDVELVEINGVIASHHFTGFDVNENNEVPITTFTTLHESIIDSTNLKEIYIGCCEHETICSNIKFISKEMLIDYANYKFEVENECLDPAFEIMFIDSYRKQITKKVFNNRPKQYATIADLAKEYMES